MASTAIPLLKDRRAVMIKNHGTLTTGPTIEAAFKAMITLEDVARLYWLVLAAGAQAETLSAEQIHKMRTTPKPKAKRV
jgi:ribulose-5-phosphate 4-epimerase/fuculose-1-phosphate aldolase